MGKICEYPAAVRRLPPKQFHRQLIGVVPRHFLRDEVIDAGLLINLRQLPGVSEGVRIPSDADIGTKFFFKVAFSDQQLSHQRLTIRHVQIRFHPHSAEHFPTALLDAINDLLMDGWIFFKHPLVVGGGRLCVCILRILVHKLERGSERPSHNVHGFCPRPKPRCIDMRIAGHAYRSLLQIRLEGFEQRMRFVKRSIEVCLIGSS